MSTLIFRQTKKFNDGFFEKHCYNFTYMMYQLGMILSQIPSRFFLVEFLPLYPMLQFLNLLLIIYVGMNSKFKGILK
jgi:hypothetical protein